MTGYYMKKKIAAVLCAMMISGCMPLGALAEGNDQEPLVVAIQPRVDSADQTQGDQQTGETLMEKKLIEKADLQKLKNVLLDEANVVEADLSKTRETELKKQVVKAQDELIKPIKIEKKEIQLSTQTQQQTQETAPTTQLQQQTQETAPTTQLQQQTQETAPTTQLQQQTQQTAPTTQLQQQTQQTAPTTQLQQNNMQTTQSGSQLSSSGSQSGSVTETEYAEFEMSASVSNGVIIVKVDKASDKEIHIEVRGNGFYECNGIHPQNGKGEGVLGKYDDDEDEIVALDPGQYTVTAYYTSEESVKKTATVVVLGSTTVTPPSSENSGTTGGGDTGGSENLGSGSNVGSNGGGTDTLPSSGTEDAVKAFTILPVVTESDGSIAVVIDGASSREIEVKLIDKDGKTVGASAIIGGGLVQLGKFASGTYTVYAQYVSPVVGADGSYDYKRVSAQAIVPEGVTAPDQIEAVDIQAKIEKGKDYIIVTVTEAADVEMMVSVDGLADKAITKGGSVRYEGLTPGESYSVEIDYINYVEGAKKYSETVTIDKPVVLGEIKITAVTPGVNMLTVSGTATAGQQVILSTTPAAASDVYAMADASGAFKAEIACAAGTYTAVTAKYSADTTKSTTLTSNWVVAAPVAKPTLTIDPIDSNSTTVIAKTTAGIVVEIKASDYTQKVTADSSGVLRFSLPHTYAADTVLSFVVYYGNGESFTQTAKVAKAEYVFTLEYGWEGDLVKRLTARLEALGYPVKETSRYGSTVREAVRLFQIANGLKADGIAGAETQKAIYSVSAIPYGAGKYPTLVRGDKGMSLIYTLQQRLKDLGYYTIKVDGIFGSGTQRAVREFQRVNGLTVTGKADNATQTLLYSSAAKGISYAVTGDYKTLSRTSKYKSAVVPLQKRLKSLGYYSGNIDGYFGSQTYRAVRNFQNRNGLTVTGVADPYTQQVLYSSSARAYSGSTASSGSSISYRLLYWGCRGDDVKRLQQALINAGYKSLVRKADGVFGQWTYDAVRAYQKDHGLAVDGIAGKNTQNKLFGTKY